MFDNRTFGSRRVLVNYARASRSDTRRADASTKGELAPSRTLFIGNMSYEMTDRDLNNLFSKIQNVIDVRVAIDRRSGQPRGFAHAEFTDVESAMKARQMLEGKEVCGRVLRLDYSGFKRGQKPDSYQRRDESDAME